MLPRRLLLAVLLAGFSTIVWANPVDPDISIDAGSDSPPINVGSTFSTNGNGGGVADFENDSGFTISALQFQTTVASFSPSLFNCQSGFFLDCTFTFNSDTDLLTIDFFGVNPADPLAETPCDTEFGEQEGIPTVQTGCAGVGHFVIDLNNGNVPGANGVGGWAANSSFTVSEVVTPEPSVGVLLGAGMLLIGGFARRRAPRA